MKKNIAKYLSLATALLCGACASTNDTEELFPLPNILKSPITQTEVKTAQDWNNIARPEILEFFQKNVYGEMLPRPKDLKFELFESSDNALEGTAIRKQYKVVSTDVNGSHSFNVLVYIPKNAKGKVPAFVCPNFWGTYSITDDKAIPLRKYKGYTKTKVKESDRGCRPERIPVRDIIARGFAIATFCYCDVYLDMAKTSTASTSIYKIFPDSISQEKLAIPAWAWGNMRVIDILETLPEIDNRKICLAGHSRLAKTAVYTAAYDERISLACINGGGCKRLCFLPNLRFPFWFSKNLKQYVENYETGIPFEELKKLCAGKKPLPVEQYALIACIAPRSLYLATSDNDKTAAPYIHFPAIKGVEPVYKLFGAKDFPPAEMETSPTPYFGDIAYHCKKGVHSITKEDWKNFLDYAQKLGF